MNLFKTVIVVSQVSSHVRLIIYFKTLLRYVLVMEYKTGVYITDLALLQAAHVIVNVDSFNACWT